MKIKQIGDLEIEECAKAYPKKLFIVQMLSWIGMLLIVVAAFIGFTAPGILGTSIVSSPNNPLAIEYYRFVRRLINHKIKLHIQSEKLLLPQDTLRIAINSSYLNNMDIKQIIPAPIRVEAQGVNIIYNFLIKPSHQPVVITFTFEPEEAGIFLGQFYIENYKPVIFKQFIYP